MLYASSPQDQKPKVLENIGGFPSGSLVWTPRGKVPIQRLKVGDKVLSFDLETGGLIEGTVSETHSYELAGLWEIVVNDERITLNPDHRFYLAETHNWSEAKNLKPGDVVLNKENERLQVSGSRAVRANHVMYELSVDASQNYFVGNSGILVHNFAFAIPVVTWVIGEGFVWAASLATIAVVAGSYIVLEASKPSKKYCDGQGNIDLDKFQPGKKDGRSVLIEPKSGHYLEDDRLNRPHGGSRWKLKDAQGNRIGTITCDGRLIRD